MNRRFASNRTKRVGGTIWDDLDTIKEGKRYLLSLYKGEPDFETPIHVIEAAKKALDDGYTHYAPRRGFPGLRSAISNKLKEYNLDYDPLTEIITTSGGNPSQSLSIMATINPGDEVLIEDPIWPFFNGTVRVAGGVPINFSLLENETGFVINPDEMRKKVTKKTKMIIINSPNNPTGSVLDRKTLEAIAEIAHENDLLVLSDEVYAKLVYDDNKHVSIASLPRMKERAIVTQSFSKEYAMTGWRMGYIAASREIIDAIYNIKNYTHASENAVTQMAAIVALESSQDSVSEMVRTYKRRRDFVVKRINEMKDISCHTPQAAFYVFANIKKLGLSSFDLAKFLIEEARVVTVPGIGFGEFGEGYLRLSFSYSVKHLKEGLKRIETAIKKIGQNETCKPK